MDFYGILGVNKDCTQEDIRVAYKRRSLETHPDKCGNAEDFRTVKLAYDTLKDVRKRNLYDKFGYTDINGEDEIKKKRLLEKLFNSGVENYFLVPFLNLRDHLNAITLKLKAMEEDLNSLKNDLILLEETEGISLIRDSLKNLLSERTKFFIELEKERILCENILEEFTTIEQKLGRSFIKEIIVAQRRTNG